MKRGTLLLGVMLMALAGCVYTVPFTDQHTIPVDPAVLGFWGPMPEGDEQVSETDRMLILKYSDTEYLVEYPTGPKGEYYRAYAFNLGGVDCIQLELIGTADGQAVSTPEKYLAARYTISGDILEIKTANPDILPGDPATSEALQKVFLEHKDNPELFTNPGKFRRISK